MFGWKKKGLGIFALLFGAFSMMFGLASSLRQKAIETSAESYSISFATGSGDGTEASTSTACSSLLSSGATYFSGNLAVATKTYYGGDYGLKLGTAKNEGVIQMPFASSLRLVSVFVQAKRYSDATRLSVNGSTALLVAADFAEYQFVFDGVSVSSSYLQLSATKYMWIRSVTLCFVSEDYSSATYSVTAKDTISSSGTVPTSSSCTLVETYTTSQQMTRGNTQTYTWTNYGGKRIVGLVLSMKSNASSGAGYISLTNGSTTIASLGSSESGVTFSNETFHGEWSTSYVDVKIPCRDVIIASGTNMTLIIGATASSLFCESVAIRWQDAVDLTPTAISLNHNNLSLDVGHGATLSATLTPVGAVGGVTWTSSNSSIATVSSSGVVNALAEGTATISATTINPLVSASCSVTVHSSIYHLVTSTTGIAESDEVMILNHAHDKALSGISTTSTKYGTLVDASADGAFLELSALDGTELFEVEEGSASGTFSFHGLGFGGGSTPIEYLYWNSDNSLNQTSTVVDKSSWVLSAYSSDGMTITNQYTVGDGSPRVLRFNSDRFACYTSSTGTLVDIYKKVSSVSVETAPVTIYEVGDYFDPTGLVVTVTSDGGTTDDYDYATYSSDFAFTPSLSTPLTYGTTSVSISFRGLTTTQSITVSYASAEEVTIYLDEESVTEANVPLINGGITFNAVVSPNNANPAVTWSVVSATKDAGGSYDSSDYKLVQVGNEGSLSTLTGDEGTIVLKA
nr:Ig-like domain-containing protein [Bacilli bacterium]